MTKLPYKTPEEMWEKLRKPTCENHQHYFWYDRNPPYCLMCGAIEKLTITYDQKKY